MTRVSTFLAGVVLLVACSQPEGPTAPQVTSAPGETPLAATTTHNRQRDPITEDVIFQNPCNGEDIQVHIRQLFTLHEVSVDGKFYHGHLTFNDRGTSGVGLTTGAVYHQTGAEQEFFHLKGEVNQSRRIEVTINLIAQGSVPNRIFQEIFRLLVSPTGELKVEFDKVKDVCQG